MSFKVVVTYQDSAEREIEWRGEFTLDGLGYLYSDFANSCESGSFEHWINGERQNDE